jgi:hypothetical protein
LAAWKRRPRGRDDDGAGDGHTFPPLKYLFLTKIP